jgi:hypothetical protein
MKVEACINFAFSPISRTFTGMIEIARFPGQQQATPSDAGPFKLPETEMKGNL